MNTPDSVETFLQSIEHTKRREDGYKLLKLMEEATKAKPKLWGTSIIGFGTNHYVYESGREGDTVAVGFSPRKAALVVYCMLQSTRAQYNIEDLGKVTTGKGCLYIKSLDDVNLELLRTIIREAYIERNNA